MRLRSSSTCPPRSSTPFLSARTHVTGIAETWGQTKGRVRECRQMAKLRCPGAKRNLGPSLIHANRAGFGGVDGRMRPSLREHRGLLEGERKSRFLHSAVACAPAPVGMTRLLCNGRCWPNAPVGSGPLAPHSRRKTWATTLGGKMGNVPLARFIQNQLFIMKRYKRVHLRGSAGWE